MLNQRHNFPVYTLHAFERSEDTNAKTGFRLIYSIETEAESELA